MFGVRGRSHSALTVRSDILARIANTPRNTRSAAIRSDPLSRHLHESIVAPLEAKIEASRSQAPRDDEQWMVPHPVALDMDVRSRSSRVPHRF